MLPWLMLPLVWHPVVRFVDATYRGKRCCRALIGTEATPTISVCGPLCQCQHRLAGKCAFCNPARSHNTACGVRNVSPHLIDAGVAFAANEQILKIILPAAVPFVMTGIRLGVGRAIIGMVVAEFFTAINGLGSFSSFPCSSTSWFPSPISTARFASLDSPSISTRRCSAVTAG
jgi:hypothetical protein